MGIATQLNVDARVRSQRQIAGHDAGRPTIESESIGTHALITQRHKIWITKGVLRFDNFVCRCALIDSGAIGERGEGHAISHRCAEGTSLFARSSLSRQNAQVAPHVPSLDADPPGNAED
ncbi:unannotated protein [freshwater metagenome]|uniref:Unannotated protein n=1 Tax=freshwater metagenome TaxID=449393 RepID=A0A6J7GWT4_9ZZZZ